MVPVPVAVLIVALVGLLSITTTVSLSSSVVSSISATSNVLLVSLAAKFSVVDAGSAV